MGWGRGEGVGVSFVSVSTSSKNPPPSNSPYKMLLVTKNATLDGPALWLIGDNFLRCLAVFNT